MTNERNLVLARFLRSQIAAASRPPVGCVQINNEEAELCAQALEHSADPARCPTCSRFYEQRCPVCGPAGFELFKASDEIAPAFEPSAPPKGWRPCACPVGCAADNGGWIGEQVYCRRSELNQQAEPKSEVAEHAHVNAICVAYESGYGHGLANDAMVNPYLSAGCEREAYRLGREEGLREHSRVNRSVTPEE